MRDYWEDIPEGISEAMLKIVRLLESNGSFSGYYFQDTASGDEDVSYQIRLKSELIQLMGPGDVLFTLEVLGFLNRDVQKSYSGMFSFSITPEALEFASYKRRTRLGRWWHRVVRPNAIAVGAFSTGMLAVLLTLAQLYELLRNLHVLP